MKQWIRVDFTQEEIDKAKLNNPHWKARFDSNRRWVGQIGEEAFRWWCTSEGITFIDYTDKGASWVDFEANGRKIDVKTVGTKYYPKEDYGCNVDAEQNQANKDADTYVFIRFLYEENYAVILGWITKENFNKNSVTRMPEKAITDHFTPVKEFQEVLITDLEPMYTL